MKSDDRDVLETNVSQLLEGGGSPPKIADAARTRIRAELVARHGVVAPTRRPLFAVGAGLAVAAGAALIVTRVVGGGVGDGPVVAPDTGKLADGSTWIVEPGADVTVIGPRHVRVTGAALLDVAPGKGTFVVETRQGRIEVLGTRFMVQADDGQTTTAVVRGQVRLVGDAGEVILHAGEQGIAEHARPPTRMPAPRLSHLVSWAAQARHRDEHDVEPIHHGTLFAKDPGVRSHPPWGEEYPLPMAQLKVDVVVENQVARVALDQTFHNNENQDLEGTYRFAIPPDASLQRLAMYVEGKLMESAVVERQQARRIYEELVYRRVDPALLEWSGTGRLNLRVYPIPARQDKRLVLAYTQSLPKLYDDYTLAIPFPEIDQPVGEVAFDVRVKGCAECELTSTSHQLTVTKDGADAVLSYKKTNDKIGDSLVVHVRDPRKVATVAITGTGDERYLMVRAPSQIGGAAKPYHARTWVILDDVSASRGAMERRAQADLVDAFMKELDEDDKVAVVAFDVTSRDLLAPTRVLDVDRRALRTKLGAEGGVGATDFGVALERAAALLGTTSPDDAMVVYLGDGVITSGTRKLDELRARLVGHAHFIGVGVGDGPDTQTLQALAGATGGFATTIELADDVAWRAFDLVAALHTQRATGVTARLLDAHGAPVDATAYLRAPQLADGEEIELVAHLIGPTPSTVELTGTRDGAPWTQTIALGAPKTDAAYLPRLWAARHIAARMLAKHEPVVVPDCTVTRGKASTCPTEATVREARDEAIRKEVIGLGKKYFLLSRHTSLLVLENDDMYKHYDVVKGAGQTWAPYAMPPTIPVVVSPLPKLATNVAPEVEVVRSPISVFYDYSTYNNQYWSRDRWAGNDDLEGGMELGGAVAGPMATGAVTTRSAMALDEGASGKREADNGDVAKAAKAEPDQSIDASENKHASVVTTAQLYGEAEAQQERIGGMRGHGAGTGGFGFGRRGYRGWSTVAQQLVLQRLGQPADQLFDDLPMWVPALVRDDFDGWRALLVHDDLAHPVDPTAAALLTRSRAALPSGVYRWDDLEIALDDARHVGWRRTTEADLAETASFDGATWTRRYPELGLDVTRTLGDDAVAFDLAYLPILVGEPGKLAHYFAIAATGAHQVTLSAVAHGKTTPRFVLDFDAADHLVAMTDAAGKRRVEVTWSSIGPTAARIDDTTVQLSFTAQAIGDATAWAHRSAPAQAVVVELPLHLAAFAKARVDATTSGNPAWRQAQRQLIATYAALGDRLNTGVALVALHAQGGVELGDLVLAANGLPALTDKDFAAVLAPFGTSADRPVVARYAFASRAYTKDHKPSSFAHPTEQGLVAQLFTLRQGEAQLIDGAVGRAIDTLLTLDGRAWQLHLVAAAATQNYAQKPRDTARLWDAAAVGPYKNVARAYAAVAMWNRGDYDAGAERIAQLVADLDLTALPPRLDQAPYLFAQSRRGTAGWQIVWATWRERVLASGSYDQVMAILPLAAQNPLDSQAILARAAVLAGDDAGRRVELARIAMSRGQAAWAQTLVDPLLASHKTRELYQLAAQLALAQGRDADALAHLEAAQGAAGDEAVDINIVRSELGQILEVSRRVVASSSGAARDAAIARALAWGNKWRAVDANNPAIDQQLGELLLAAGDKAGAWRQLSTVIERDPMAGQGYITVAEAFERQGRVAEALEFWQEAIVIEQTNPTPRLRKAQALIALGRAAEGDAILDDIAHRTWHEVWSGVVYQAKNLRDRGKPQNFGNE